MIRLTEVPVVAVSSVKLCVRVLSNTCFVCKTDSQWGTKGYV